MENAPTDAADNRPAPTGREIVLIAGAICDAAGRSFRPGAIRLRDGRILDVGDPSAVTPSPEATVIRRSGAVLLPALVNAHSHLDLTHIGPRPYTGRFTDWVGMIRAERAVTDDGIDRAVRRGIELALAGGTGIIGDIAGINSLQPWRTLRDSPLAGVSFIEHFGLGPRQARAIEQMQQLDRDQLRSKNNVTLGLQPHAPYSCGPDVFAAAARVGRPLATHIAETPEELAYCRDGRGPIVDMLRAIGVWDESIEPLGGHPLDALSDSLHATPWLIAHLNYIEDRHIEVLARLPGSVAYCPRASEYFGHPVDDQPPHAYRAMLDAGVNVCLGTDGLVCLDTPDRISVLDEMRRLHRRDGTDPDRLLAMATTNGARALGLDPDLVTFAPGDVAGIIAVPFDPGDPADPLTQVLRRTDPPAWASPAGAGELMTADS